MRSTLHVALATSAAMVALSATSAAHAGTNSQQIFPLSKVRKGQKGYGLTTMQGTTPDRFEFEVIGVNKNFLAKMDIILVKSDDKKMEVTGFWQGMSGSPLFIDGKLACAFSYGFRFNKVAIGGCTPIEYMKKEGFKPLRHVNDEAERRGHASTTGGKPGVRRPRIVAGPRAAGTRTEWLEVTDGGHLGSAMARADGPRTPWMLGAPLPRGPTRPAGASTDRGMTAHALPLTLSGFSAPAFEHARAMMSNYPLEAMQAGGTGDGDSGPTELIMGASMGMQLVRGDMSAAVTCTVSYVEGDGVLACGHPVFQTGEMYAPVTTSMVHTVIPSAQSAFVVSDQMREVGTLVQDRQSTIAADTGLKARMIPMSIRIDAGQGASREKNEFNVEILDNRFFTGALAGMATMNAVSLYLPDRDHVTATIKSKVKVKGFEPLAFTDYLYSATGADDVVSGARGLRVLAPLLLNPFAPLEIERVDVDVQLDWELNYGDIRSLRMPSRELEPGKKAYVDVELTRFDGKPVVDRVPFTVPDSLAGSIVRVEVTAGDSAQLDAAPPESVGDLMKALRRLLPGNVYAVTLYTAEEGAAIDGKVIRDLPSSALDKLYTGSATPRLETYRAMARSTSKAPRVVNGKQSVLVKIKDVKR
jgi:hypothetical protein